MVRIAVEEPLTDVQQELRNRGYQADILANKVNAVNYDCIVVRNKADLDDIHMNVPLVEARGRSVDEIVEKVEEHLRRAGKIALTSKIVKKKKQGAAAKSFATGMAMGTAVGAAVGMLFAPTKGKNARQKITDTATKTTAVVGKAKNMVPGGKKEETTDIAPKEQVEPQTPPVTTQDVPPVPPTPPNPNATPDPTLTPDPTVTPDPTGTPNVTRNPKTPPRK